MADQSKPKLFISFSGGETSAMMTDFIHKTRGHIYDILVMVANTGQENNETLDFIKQCDDHFGWNVVWVEAVVQHGSRVGSLHRVVNYETARRIDNNTGGTMFEEVIDKYGIPNVKYQHCTRELKLNPMRSYLRSIGWTKGSYETAIGIRADETRRISKKQTSERIVYPFIDWTTRTKEDVNDFWNRQPFRLNLKDYEGNCRWCWKKSITKHVKLINDKPDTYDFPERMEREKGLKGHNVDGTHRVFFRGNQSTNDLRNLAKIAEVNDEPERPDEVNGCSESCELYPTD
tara:strand:- start:87 stop:953 length:867 start_codon:yes stop_codon:yes gene_type:complete